MVILSRYFDDGLKKIILGATKKFCNDIFDHSPCFLVCIVKEPKAGSVLFDLGFARRLERVKP